MAHEFPTIYVTAKPDEKVIEAHCAEIQQKWQEWRLIAHKDEAWKEVEKRGRTQEASSYYRLWLDSRFNASVSKGHDLWRPFEECIRDVAYGLAVYDLVKQSALEHGITLEEKYWAYTHSRDMEYIRENGIPRWDIPMGFMEHFPQCAHDTLEFWREFLDESDAAAEKHGLPNQSSRSNSSTYHSFDDPAYQMIARLDKEIRARLLAKFKARGAKVYEDVFGLQEMIACWESNVDFLASVHLWDVEALRWGQLPTGFAPTMLFPEYEEMDAQCLDLGYDLILLYDPGKVTRVEEYFSKTWPYQEKSRKNGGSGLTDWYLPAPGALQAAIIMRIPAVDSGGGGKEEGKPKGSSQPEQFAYKV